MLPGFSRNQTPLIHCKDQKSLAEIRFYSRICNSIFVQNLIAVTSSNPDRVFMTGATGFIGSHIAEYFCSKGVEVECGVRATSNLSFLKSLPLKIRFIDLNERESLLPAMEQAGFVIHTAGVVDDWSPYPEFYETNVVGTQNLMNACVAAGIRNVIVTGSSASYGEEDSPETKDEASPDHPRYDYFLERLIPNRLNYYRVTKHMATQEAALIAKANNINLTILEPVWVYGEREFSSGFYEYMRAVSSRIPFFPGSSKNHFHVIYAGELARAYYQAYVKRLRGVNRILIGNVRIDLMNRIYELFCKEMGLKKPVNLPKILVYPIGLMMEMAALMLRLKQPPLLSRSRVNMMYDNIAYGTRKAEELLAFRAEVPVEEGIARTVQWYKKNNLI